MPDLKSMVRLRESDIVIGKPMAWAAYDSQGRLLLNRGVMVRDINQVRGLIQRGLFRESVERERGEAPEVVEDESRKPATQLLPFENLKLVPGEAMQVQHLAATTKETYNVRLLGYAKGRSVMTTLPEAGGKLMHVTDGQIFAVRAFSGLVIGTFSAKVLKVQHSPYPYMHLAYPANGVQTMRLRKAMRATVDLETAVFDKEGGNIVATGIIDDISVGGARMLISKPVGRKGQIINIGFKVQLGEIEEWLKTTATVRAVQAETGDDGMPRNTYGLQFENLTREQHLLIMNLVYKLTYKDTL